MMQEPNKDDRDVVLRLMKMAGEVRPEAEDGVEAADYDWKTPYRFTRDQVGRLNDFARLAAQKVSEKLNEALQDEITFEPDPVMQQYALELRKSADQVDREYCVEISESGRPGCGFIILSQAYAVTWVQKLLGGGGKAGDDRTLLSLESELLLDIAGELTKGLSDASKESGGAGLSRGETLLTGEYPLEEGDAQDYCRFTFRRSEGETGGYLSFVVLSEALLPMVGVEKATQGAKADPKTRQDILGHLGKVSVKTDIFLGTAAATMREVMALEPGDVLLIQKRINEPIEMFLHGRKVLTGFPGVSGGKYALQVETPPGTRE